MYRINRRPLCSNAEMGIKSILWYKPRWTEEKSAFAHFQARAAKKKNEKRNSQTCLVLQFITYDVWSSCRFYHRLIGRFYVSTPVGQETEKKMGYSVTHSSRSWTEETCAARISQHWPWSRTLQALTTVLDPISHNHRCSTFSLIIMLQFR